MTAKKVISFEHDDKLSLTKFCDQLETFIETERNFVEGSLVISLNGSFGSGKSHFLKMWADRITRRQSENEATGIQVILNSWESDYTGEPLLAIVSAISKALEDKGPQKSSEVNPLREAAKDLAWFSLALANGFVSNSTGIDAIASAEFAETKQAKRHQHLNKCDLLSTFEHRIAALQRLKTELSILCAKNSKILIMVDELDRCRPDYAVQYLETIKHVFDIPGITFILAVDKDQLASSVEALYGPRISFNEYYRKFAHRNIQLPPLHLKSVSVLVSHYINLFLENQGTREARTSIIQDWDTMQKRLTELLTGMQLLPRQIQEVFRILGHIFAKNTPGKTILPWCYYYATVFLASTSVSDPRFFNLLRSKKLTSELIVERLRTYLPSRKTADWWITLLVIGYRIPNDKFDLETEGRYFQKLDIFSKALSTESVTSSLSQFYQGWGDIDIENGGLGWICVCIDEVRNFSS